MHLHTPAAGPFFCQQAPFDLWRLWRTPCWPSRPVPISQAFQLCTIPDWWNAWRHQPHSNTYMNASSFTTPQRAPFLTGGTHDDTSPIPTLTWMQVPSLHHSVHHSWLVERMTTPAPFQHLHECKFLHSTTACTIPDWWNALWHQPHSNTYMNASSFTPPQRAPFLIFIVVFTIHQFFTSLLRFSLCSKHCSHPSDFFFRLNSSCGILIGWSCLLAAWNPLWNLCCGQLMYHRQQLWPKKADRSSFCQQSLTVLISLSASLQTGMMSFYLKFMPQPPPPPPPHPTAQKTICKKKFSVIFLGLFSKYSIVSWWRHVN